MFNACNVRLVSRARSQRAVARDFGLSRETVRKRLQYAVRPGYQRQQPIKRPKLGPSVGVVDAILKDDKQRLAKQRRTAKRIFERLNEEHQFTGGYTIAKDYVWSAELHSREMFIPVTHAPGEAQAEFGEALVVIAGVEQKAHYLAMDLPHSDDCFVAAFWPRPLRHFWKARFEHLRTPAAYPRGFSTTTARSPWPRYLAVRGGRRRGPPPSYRVTICSPTSSAARPRATIRARSKAWSAIHAGTRTFLERDDRKAIQEVI
jgi:hypothetical protein